MMQRVLFVSKIAGKWCFKLFQRKLLNINIARWRSADVIHKLTERTLIKEIFPNNVQIKAPGTPCAYAGFDATANSLHLGNLLILVSLIHWQRGGNQSIIVVGDSTAQIGDPSGHKTDRHILSSDVIDSNAEAIEKSVYRIFENHETYLWSRKYPGKKHLLPPKVLRNSSWYKNISVVDVISKAGRHLRIGDMLSRSSVKSRMDNEEGMNFSEFSYQLFQSYDWLHLLEKYNCHFQFGGNDQHGNVLSGYTMISGLCGKTVYGAFVPLIVAESGDKFGKSSGNALYLNPENTAPFDLYQYLLRLPDSDVEKFLRLFTFLTLEEVEDVLLKHMKNLGKRIGQNKIAEEVLLLVHGKEGLDSAIRATKMFFKSDLESLIKMTVQELKQAFPPSSLIHIPFEHGISLLDLALKAKMFLNEADALRIIQEGGLHMNFTKTCSPNIVLTPGVHILPNGTTLIRIGKKTNYVVLWQ